MSGPTGDLPACVVLAEEVWGSALHVVRSLGRDGVPVHVATAGVGSDVFGASRWCRSTIDLDPADEDAYLDALLPWLAGLPGPGPIPLIPLSDRLVELLDRHRDRFDARTVPLVPAPAVVAALVDKVRSLGVAEAAGLRVPPWIEVASAADLDAARALALPVAVRPTAWSTGGAAPFKVRRVTTTAALDDLLTRALADGARLVVQEFVEGPDSAVELGILWRSGDRSITAVCTGRKRRQTSVDGGVMVWGEAVDRPDVRAAATAFLDASGLTGLGGVELKRADGHLWFIEANPRLEAIHFLAARAGVDTVRMAYREAALGELPPHVPRQGRASAWIGTAWLQQVRSDPRAWRRAVADRIAFARAPHRVRAVGSWQDPRPAAILTWRLATHALRSRTGRSAA